MTPHPQPQHPLEMAVENIGKNTKITHHQHCDHECVCMIYEIAFKKGWRKQGAVCTNGGCEHDTRATHTPAAPAMERLGFTEFCYVHCDKHECCTNECERAAKDEREQVLDVLEEFLNSDDHLSIFKWEVREQIGSLRGGGAP